MAGRRFASDAELGQQTRQLRTPDRCKRVEGVHVLRDAGAPECVDPDSERQDPLGLVRAAQKDSDAARVRIGDQRHEDTALADSRLTYDGDDAPVSSRRLT